MSAFRRRLMMKRTSKGVKLPEYDKSVYPYYALLRGYVDDALSVKKYVFVVSSTKKSTYIPTSTFRFTSNYGAYAMYNSDDGIAWELVASGNTATINTNLHTPNSNASLVEIIEENIIIV